MKHVTVGGLRLEYLDLPAIRPNAPVLVLLHEGLGCVAMWRDFPQKLAAATGCRVVAGSRAGYGHSDAYAEARRPDYMHREAHEALPAFLAALDIERPVLVGHSDGGSIALLFAAAFPGVPLGTVVMAPHEFVEEVTLSGIRDARRAWETTPLPERLGRYHADVRRVFFDWNDTWLSPAFRDWNIEGCLPAITGPLLAMQGEQDEYATMRQIEVIAEACPQTRLVRLADCGHSPHRDQEAAVLSEIVAFVSRLSGS